MKRFLLCVASLLATYCLPSVGEATTINVACSNAAIQAGVDSAAANDTVLIASGTCTITTRIVVPSRPMVITGASCTLNSKGKPISCPVRLVDGTDYGGSTYGVFYWVTSNTTGNHEISNIWIDGGSTSGTLGDPPKGMIIVMGNTGSWNFHHNLVTTARAPGMLFYDYVRGVNHHNQYQMPVFKFAHYVSHGKWNDNANGCGSFEGACGDASWADDSHWGSEKFLFFEDNWYNTTVEDPVGGNNAISVNDMFTGARVVFRFNEVDNGNFSDHGLDSVTRRRGVRAAEVYRNKFRFTGQCDVNPSTCNGSYYSSSGVLGPRGGTYKVIQNNIDTVDGGFVSYIYNPSFYRYTDCSEGIGDGVSRACGPPWWRASPISITLTSSGTTATATSSVPHFLAGPDSAGNVNTVRITNAGSFNGTYAVSGAQIISATQFRFTFAGCGNCSSGTGTASSAWDQTDTGYPAMEMQGRGGGDLNPSGLLTTPAAWLNQALDPVYIFQHRKDGNYQAPLAALPSQENRDWYRECTAASGCTFNGTVGIGTGLRSARPATCTTGVAYWATDGGGNWNTSTTETMSAALNLGLTSGADGALDICTSTNTWTNDAYKPYQYPHHLVTGTSAANASKFRGAVGGVRHRGNVRMQ